jgi:hypothetical protein
MCGYFARDAEDLRKAYGDFILINTNFGEVNAFYPSENLFLPPSKPGEEPTFGPTAVGMSRKFAEGLRDYKQAIFRTATPPRPSKGLSQLHDCCSTSPE